MADLSCDQVRVDLDELYRTESRRILATLIRLLGDFDQAEEALYEAFRAALETWPEKGIPALPRAWLVSAGRFKGIDALRRRKRFDDVSPEVAERYGTPLISEWDGEDLEDDRLRLIFTCCHPALAPEARVALTLRELCGLTTEEIARAFLTAPPTLAQRIVRAKSKIRDAGIPYQVPPPEELSERLATVLQVIYLLFNEGYFASSGSALTRTDLSDEAIRLGRLLVELLPEPEALGLLGLMLLQESRRTARSNEAGDLILLEDQDRGLWRRDLIEEGLSLVDRALAARPDRPDPYTIQAAIAAVHARALDASATDWARIAGLYTILARLQPSPVVELNRAVAVAMDEGPAAGLIIVDDIIARGALEGYHLVHSVRADFLRRLGRWDEARQAYGQALALARQEPERRFLERRLRELGGLEELEK